MPISIFIPVWNDARWLPGAIESVLGQTYPHWELIIGDNASDDDLQAIVAGYSDARVRYHRWSTHTPAYENQNRTWTLCRYAWSQLLCADGRYINAVYQAILGRNEMACVIRHFG